MQLKIPLQILLSVLENIQNIFKFSDLRKTGIADQGDNSDNTSITYVAEESLEGFGDYDYDDYYDDEEEVEPEPEPEDTNDDHSKASPESQPEVTEDTGKLIITV